LNEKLFVPDKDIKLIIDSLRDVLLPDGYELEIDWKKLHEHKYWIFRVDKYSYKKVNIDIDHILIHSMSSNRFVKRLRTRDLAFDLMFYVDNLDFDRNFIPFTISLKSIKRRKINLTISYNANTDEFYIRIITRDYNWSWDWFIPFPDKYLDKISIDKIYIIFKLLYPLLEKIMEVLTKGVVE